MQQSQILNDYHVSDNVAQIAKQTAFEFDILEAFQIMYEKECIRNY
jgi:hypothetical protein